jgi:hypothetical protein
MHGPRSQIALRGQTLPHAGMLGRAPNKWQSKPFHPQAIYRMPAQIAGCLATSCLLINNLQVPRNAINALRRFANRQECRYSINNNVTNRRWQASIVLAHRSWRPHQPTSLGRLQLHCQSLALAAISSARSRTHEPALTRQPLAAVGPDPL